MKITIKRYYPLVMLIFFITIVCVVKANHVSINISPSMKEGIYISEGSKKIHPGGIVLFCLNKSYTKLGIERHYLIKGTTCNGSLPLIKQVLAVPGDTVELTPFFIEINGKRYFYKTLHHDSLGRVLFTFPRGIYRNGYWMIGSNDIKSWDSRYWGPINSDQIISVMKPVLTW